MKGKKAIFIFLSIFLSIAILVVDYIVIKSVVPGERTETSNENQKQFSLIPNHSDTLTSMSDSSLNSGNSVVQEPIYLASPDPNYNMQGNSQGISGSRAYRELSELEQAPFSRASATSQIYASGLNYYADKAIDGSIKTSWQENVEGQGIGEALTVFFDSVTDISYIGILAGSFESEEAYYANSRIKKAKFEFSDGASFDYFFDDIPNISLIELSRTVSTRYIKITIEDVFPGKTWDDTAIAEVFAYR